jgi:hypothetical protein
MAMCGFCLVLFFKKNNNLRWVCALLIRDSSVGIGKILLWLKHETNESCAIIFLRATGIKVMDVFLKTEKLTRE